jgi:hypothetical protein
VVPEVVLFPVKFGIVFLFEVHLGFFSFEDDARPIFKFMEKHILKFLLNFRSKDVSTALMTSWKVFALSKSSG